MSSQIAKIDYRDTIYFLEIPGREAPMGFFTCASAMSFAVNNLRLKYQLSAAATVAWHKEAA